MVLGRNDGQVSFRGDTLSLRLRPVLGGDLLGMALVERTLAAEFYASGRDDLERANISVLLREARDKGWLSIEEYEALIGQDRSGIRDSFSASWTR